MSKSPIGGVAIGIGTCALVETWGNHGIAMIIGAFGVAGVVMVVLGVALAVVDAKQSRR